MQGNKSGWMVALIAGVALASQAAVKINEVQCSNDETLTDERGRTCDWVELHNDGDSAVDLSGWGLSDKASKPFKWTFRSGAAIPAGGYLVVYCDGSDFTTNVEGRIYHHAPLSLSQKGDSLYLTERDTSVPTDGIEFGRVPCDCSFGRGSDGESWGYFADPTPGAANPATSATEVLAPVQFSRERCLCSTTFQLVLSHEDPAAVIHYTLDHSVPTASSPVYTGPITISGTTIVRAVPVKTGALEFWNVQTHSYIFPGQVPSQRNDFGYPSNWSDKGYNVSQPVTIPGSYSVSQSVLTNEAKINDFLRALSALPIVSITGDNDQLFGATHGILTHPVTLKDAGYPVSVEWVSGGDDCVCGADGELKINGEGGSGFNYTPKKSLRVKFKGKYGSGSVDTPVFSTRGCDETGFKTIVFRGEHNTSWPLVNGGGTPNLHGFVYLKDQFFREIKRDLDGDANPGAFCHLFINGLYWGVYNPVERPEASAGARMYGGNKDDYSSFKKMDVRDEGPENGEPFLSYMNRLYQAWSKHSKQSYANSYTGDMDMKQQANYEKAATLFDLDRFCNYMLVEYWSGNGDWPFNNWVAVGSPQQGVPYRFYLWDTENALSYNGAEGDWRMARKPGERFDDDQTRSPAFLERALTNSTEYVVKMMDSAHNLVREGGPLSQDRLSAHFNELRAYGESFLFAEEARWGAYRKDYQSKNEIHGLAEWRTVTDACYNNWIASGKRTRFFLNELSKRGFYPRHFTPEFTTNAASTVATMTRLDATNTVYYTTDGSDPREAWTGAVAATAMAYDFATEISLTGGGELKARSRTPDGKWSYLTTCRLNPSGGIRVQGICGYPDRNDDGPGEFVYLTNLSSSASVDLSGYRLKIWKRADGENAAKCNFVIPAGVVIPAGGLLRLDQGTYLWQKITNNEIGFALYDAGGALVDGGTVYQKTLGVAGTGFYAVRDLATDTWSKLAISAAPDGNVTPSAAADFYLSGHYASEIIKLVSATNATLTLDNVDAENVSISLKGLSPGVVFTVHYTDGSTNTLSNFKGETGYNLPILDASGFDLVIEGNGQTDFYGEKRLENSGIVAANNLTVNGGDTSVKFKNNKDDTSCVFLTGNYWQRDGKFHVSMPKAVSVEEDTVSVCTNEFTGIWLNTKNTWAKIDGGEFTATVGGCRSSGIRMKQTCNGYFNGGTIKGEIKGTHAKIIDGGTLSFAGSDVKIVLHDECIATNELGQLTQEALAKYAYCTNAHPIKADHAVTISGGTMKIDVDTHGTEAISTDDSVTISAGDVSLKAGDDCINAHNDIMITGGRVFAKSYYDDGIDANRDVIISGGLFIGIAFAREATGIDVNVGGTLTVNGGKVLSVGGSASVFEGLFVAGVPTYRATGLAASNYSARYLVLTGRNEDGDTETTTIRIPELDGPLCSILCTVPGFDATKPLVTTDVVPTEGDIEFHNVYVRTEPREGDVYYMQASDTAGTATAFNTASKWFDKTSGGGNHPASISDTDDFHVNGYRLRTATKTTVQTFPGKSLTLTGGSLSGSSVTSAGCLSLDRDENAGLGSALTLNFNKIIVNNGGLVFANTVDATINGPIDITNTFGLQIGGTGTRNLNLTGAITGSGTMNLISGGTAGQHATFELSGNCSGFTGTISDSGNVRTFTVKLTGSYGGTITSLPSATDSIVVNYAGLPSGTGLRFASTTIPSPVKTLVTFYGSTDFTAANLPLLTFPAGTTVSADQFMVKHAATANGAATAFGNLKAVTNANGTITLVANYSAAPALPSVPGHANIPPEDVFLYARTNKPITYPTTPTLSGTAGVNQTITFGGKTVSAPVYYDASLSGNVVSVELNENARADFADTPAAKGIEIHGGTISFASDKFVPGLYYAIASSPYVPGPYLAPETADGWHLALSATEVEGGLSVACAANSGFFRIVVRDTIDNL